MPKESRQKRSFLRVGSVASPRNNKCFHVDKIEDWYKGSDGFKPKTKLKAIVGFVHKKIAEHQQEWLPFNYAEMEIRAVEEAK